MAIIKESISFEKGKDPKSAMGVGTFADIKQRWDDLQMSQGIGSLNVEKAMGSWALTSHVNAFPGSARKIAEQVSKYMSDYVHIIETYIARQTAIFPIKEPYIQTFIDVYNDRYPDWPITESISFERGKDPKESMGIGMGIFQKIMDETGWEPAELRFTRDRLNSFNNEDPQWFLNDLHLAYDKPENFNIDKDSGYYSDIEWAIENPDWAWSLVNLPETEIYPDLIDESVSFERGKDPRETIGIGNHLARVAKKYDVSFEDAKNIVYVIQMLIPNDYIQSEFEQDISYIANDLDEYKLREYGLHPEDPNFQIIKWIDAHLQIGWELFNAARKDAGVTESISFERGKDPKDSLEIGRGLITKKIKEEANAYNGKHFFYKDIENYDYREIPIVVFKEINTDDNIVNPTEPFIAMCLLDGEYEESGFHATLGYTKKRMENIIDSWYSKKNDNFLEESVNFERGKDPKESMGIGVKDQIKKCIIDMISDKNSRIYKIDFYAEDSYVSDYLRNTLKLEFGRRPAGRYPRELIIEPIEDYLSEYVEVPYSHMYFGDPQTESYYFNVKPDFLKEFGKAFNEAVKEFVIPR